MKKFFYLFLLAVIILFFSVRNEINAQYLAKELNVTCQSLEVSSDHCIISHFNEKFEESKTPSSFFRVLHGKNKELLFMIQDFHKNGKKATDVLYVENFKETEVGKIPLPENMKIHNKNVTIYNSDGDVYLDIPLLEGVRHGIQKFYNKKQGDLIEDSYVNGRKEGISKLYVGGQLLQDEMYANDKRHGITRMYYDKEIVSHETMYVNDARNGYHKEYYENGTLKLETSYIDGEVNGVEKKYSEDGVLSEESIYVKGSVVNVKKYYKNRQIKTLTPYKNGRKHGIEREYNEDAILIRETQYVYDNIVEK